MKKSVFVTGATNGTGLAIAQRFAEEGYAVFVGSRSAENSQEAAKSIEAIAAAEIRIFFIKVIIMVVCCLQ